MLHTEVLAAGATLGSETEPVEVTFYETIYGWVLDGSLNGG